MSEFEQVFAGINLFRFQIDLVEADLTKSNYEMCSEKVYYEVVDGQPNYKKIKGKIPNTTAILPMKKPNEIEEKYPGLTEAMKIVQRAYIQESMELIAQIEEQNNHPPLEEKSLE